MKCSITLLQIKEMQLLTLKLFLALGFSSTTQIKFREGKKKQLGNEQEYQFIFVLIYDPGI